MALWKITVKANTFRQGQRLEKGMSVEIPTTTTTNPIGQTKYKEQIAEAFNNKYAINLAASIVSLSVFSCERVS